MGQCRQDRFIVPVQGYHPKYRCLTCTVWFGKHRMSESVRAIAAQQRLAACFDSCEHALQLWAVGNDIPVIAHWQNRKLDIMTEHNDSCSLMIKKDEWNTILTTWGFKFSCFGLLESAYSVANLLSNTSGPLFKTHEAQDKNYTDSTVTDEILPVFQLMMNLACAVIKKQNHTQ